MRIASRMQKDVGNGRGDISRSQGGSAKFEKAGFDKHILKNYHFLEVFPAAYDRARRVCPGDGHCGRCEGEQRRAVPLSGDSKAHSVAG